ncbi:MAG: hypothetical protein ACREH9_05400, partial [Pseudomonadota bacterium]
MPPIPVAPPTTSTAMLGLASGQTARLNLLNLGVATPQAAVVCSAEVTFLNADGNEQKPAVIVVVLPGKAVLADQFGLRIYLEAWKRGWSRAKKRVVIGDGAE